MRAPPGAQNEAEAPPPVPGFGFKANGTAEWRALAIDAVAAAKACLLALPVSDTARWNAIKDVEKRLEKMTKG